ncbi:MAG: alkyl hydroperoxide reductase [Candidatus Cloacimonadota bacterium]|nr:MAG: alkyl hydroperoxide reductase [Candidatus Cloacimonadota bacterium]
MSAVAANYEKFQELDTEVIAVSVDSQFVHKVWNDQELNKMAGKDVPFRMASDGAGHIGKAYGVYNEAAGVDFRGRFIIDPDGVIQAMEILTPPVGRKLGETLRQIKAFQHVRKTGGGEVCPAGWDEGKKVLKPGPALVANVWKEWNPKEDL